MAIEAAIRMTAPGDVYRQRRAQLAASLQRPLTIFAGHAPARNYAANAHHFRAGSSYLYFGGPPVEHAALLIEPGSDGDQGCTLLRPSPNPNHVLWTGPAPGDAELTAAGGLRENAVVPADQLEKLLDGRPAACVAPPYPDTLATIARAGLQPASADELLAIIKLRLIKDAHEIEALRRTARVSMDGHRAAMAATKPGRREADAAAAYMSTLTARECQVSFTPIVTVRGEVLHGHGHPNVMSEGAMLLIDAGAEEPTGYAGDITRTIPVSGRWTTIQRQLYDVVLRACRQATAACVPGKRFRDVHDLAARVICEGLVEVGLLRGKPEELFQRTAHALFFPHGVGHLIGLEAHDMEDFGDLAGYAPGRSRRTEFGNAYLRLDRDLEPGMCVTIEPGVYLVPAIWARDDLVGPLADVVNRTAVDKLLEQRFGGIRIEQFLCVRDADGPEVFSHDLPTDADEVAALAGTGA